MHKMIQVHDQWGYRSATIVDRKFRDLLFPYKVNAVHHVSFATKFLSRYKKAL